MSINFKLHRKPRQGLPAQILAVLGTALALALALTFSLVFLAVVAVAGVLVWGYVWWKTRELRRQLRAAGVEGVDDLRGFARTAGDATAGSASSGEIIEGESVRVVDERQRIGNE